MNHPATLPIPELLKQCQLQQTRRGGPGGQHRNKTESAIVLTHLPTGVVGQAGERRSQHENRAVAIERLRLNLALAIRTDVNAESVPSPIWQSRLSSNRIAISSDHADFPALLAEVLDWLTFDQFEISTTADHFQVSSSQLIKFLKQCPPAFQSVNQLRERTGMKKLK